MGGFSSGTINGVDVEYGDICEVVLWDLGFRNQKRLPCTFIETSDDGDRYFRFIREEDSIRGHDYFHDNYAEVGEVRFVCKADDERFFIGAGI